MAALNQGQAASPTQDWRLAMVALAVGAVVTALHYGTSMELVAVHLILRRLYYVPIVIAGVGYGLKGGLLAAVAISLAYVPHAFLLHAHHMTASAPHAGHDVGDHAGHIFGLPLSADPSPDMEKFLELVLFHAVGVVTGLQSQRWMYLVTSLQAAQVRLQQVLDQRDQFRAQLVRAEKLTALGTLTAGLAHELRNPLSSIRGSAEILADDYPEGHAKGRIASIMLKELGRLDGVLREFLQFARPPAPNPKAVALGPVVEQVLELTRQHRDWHAGLETHINVPQEDRAWVDPDHLRQILTNLLVNAAQAMPGPGAVSIVAQRQDTRLGPRMLLHVTDEGPGVPADALGHLFEPYFSSKADGTGLGLAISHSLAEANGAELDVHNSPGGGAVFLLSLPLPDAVQP